MSRIPAYNTPSQFAQELHKIGLLYDIDEDPAEQSNVITGMPSFTPDECVILNDIRQSMSSDDVIAYTNEALVIIQESFQITQAKIAVRTARDANPGTKSITTIVLDLTDYQIQALKELLNLTDTEIHGEIAEKFEFAINNPISTQTA